MRNKCCCVQQEKLDVLHAHADKLLTSIRYECSSERLQILKQAYASVIQQIAAVQHENDKTICNLGFTHEQKF